MSIRLTLAVIFLLLFPASLAAADFHFSGYADGRVIFAPTNSEPYVDGELGKLRFGEDDGHPGVHLTDIVGSGSVQVSPDFSATAVARINPEYGPAVDLIEAYVRYRPVSTNAWRWSLQAGAFFPPISLENDQLGWQPFWTLTPSAINSWIGAEIRIIGVQGTLQYRSQDTEIDINGAIFAFNDPMGVVMADRGWNFDDRPVGLFDKYRLPDSIGVLTGRPPPIRAELFKEIDQRPGWYLDVSYEPQGFGIELMTYDNNADPTRRAGGDLAWHTRFWDIGAYTQVDGLLTLLAQAMTGDTSIQPSPFFHSETQYQAAYLLAGVDLDKWWLAGRADIFKTRTRNSFGLSPVLSEDGNAWTLAANYAPETWIRLSTELLIVNSTRPQRLLQGDPASIVETQLQFAVRIFY
jgi:hypothetical protein